MIQKWLLRTIQQLSLKKIYTWIANSKIVQFIFNDKIDCIKL